MHASSESTENIDEIVQDHDNFGTDENEDDSSLDSTSSCLGMSLLVKDTPPEELMAIPANKIGGFKRKSNEDQSVNTSGFIDHSITAKKKRETFISEEQEVCLTPIGKPSKKKYFEEKKRDISHRLPVSFAFDFISQKKKLMLLVTAPKIEMLLSKS